MKPRKNCIWTRYQRTFMKEFFSAAPLLWHEERNKRKFSINHLLCTLLQQNFPEMKFTAIRNGQCQFLRLETWRQKRCDEKENMKTNMCPFHFSQSLSHTETEKWTHLERTFSFKLIKLIPGKNFIICQKILEKI